MSKPENRYHGSTEYSDMSKNTWEDCWSVGKTFFHRSAYHPMLVEHIEKLINGRSNLVIFIPLCGKSLDIKYLYDLGHTVVGVEGAKSPIEEFFGEHNLEFTKSDCPSVNGSVYKNGDNRIRIYHGDMFDFNGKDEVKFSGVWDRGSFGAINKTDRPKYVELLTSMVTEDCQYLLNTYDYNPEQFSGPPHCFTDEEMLGYWGHKWNITRIHYEDVNNDSKREKGVEYFNEQVHHLTLK